MTQTEKFKKIATDVLSAVGGKDNITNVTHCMTRLRFNLKDESIPNQKDIEKIPGVIGVTKAGGQYQIIIGQTVNKVYLSLCEIGDFKQDLNVNIDLDQPKKKITLKSIGSGILDSLAGCLTPLIPLLIAASMFKLLQSVLGPSMLGLISDTSDFYTLITFVGDAGFYFFPIMVAYTAANKFGVTPIIAMFLGAIMLHPTFVGIAAEGTSFTVFGIPANVQNYGSTIIPVIMSVWVMSYIEKFFNKYIPSTLRLILAPFLTIFIMLPISLIVLGPAGGFLGNYVSSALLNFTGVGSFIAIAVIAALWQYLVMTGMHLVMISTLILVFANNGQESIVSPAAFAASVAVYGMCLGAALRLRNKEHRSLSFGYLVAASIGGVTEPGLYGVGMRYKRPLIGMMVGGFAGGIYAGITGVTAYTMIPVASILLVLGFAGGPATNFVHGIISMVIAFVVAAVVTYFTGFKKDDPLISKQ